MTKEAVGLLPEFQYPVCVNVQLMHFDLSSEEGVYRFVKCLINKNRFDVTLKAVALALSCW